MKSTVTVLVCAYNDEDTIGVVLKALCELQEPPLEIIVVNDASTDRTRAIVEQFPVTAIHNDRNRGLGYNLNLGLRMAKGDCLAVIQSDCEVLGSDWLQQMMELMDDPAVGVVVSQREIQNFSSQPAGARMFNAVAPQDLTNPSGRPLEQLYCRGKADVYRTQLLRDLQGWDTSFFTAGEDTDLSIRIRQKGLKILLHPKARVRYLFSGRQRSVSGALKKAFLYGQTARLLYRMHGYDGIQARTYLLLLISAGCLFMPFSSYAAAFLLLYSITCRIQVSGGRGIPFVLLIAPVAAILYLAQQKFGIPRSLVAPILPSILITGGLYLLYLSAKNTWRNRRRGEFLWRLPATFAFCILWRLTSGVGYLVGCWSGLFGRSIPKAGSAFVTLW